MTHAQSTRPITIASCERMAIIGSHDMAQLGGIGWSVGVSFHRCFLQTFFAQN